MKRLTPERILPLRRVVAAQEMACKSELQAVLREERSLRAAISEVSHVEASITTGADIRAADRWHNWRMEQRKRLLRDLAAVLARKDIAQRALGLASAKTRAVDRLSELAVEQQRKDGERRADQDALHADLLARHARGRHNS